MKASFRLSHDYEYNSWNEFALLVVMAREFLSAAPFTNTTLLTFRLSSLIIIVHGAKLNAAHAARLLRDASRYCRSASDNNTTGAAWQRARRERAPRAALKSPPCTKFCELCCLSLCSFRE